MKTFCSATPEFNSRRRNKSRGRKDDYLLDLLVDLGFTTADVVAKAREEANAAGVGIVDLLVANKVIRPGDVTQAKAAQFGAEVVHLTT